MDQVLENDVETVEEAPSLRETIEEAVDAQEVTEGKPAAEPLGQPAAKSAVPEGTPSPVSADQSKPAGAVPAGVAAVPAAAPGTPAELKAPTQWKPAVREKWNQLPREVQEEVLRREGDNLRLIGSVGQKIRFADEMANHIQPFAEKLSASGATSSEFLGDVFNTVKSLASGSPQQKAEIVANIVQSYGVDLRTLDAVLSHRLQAPPPDPRLIDASRRAQAAERQLAQHQQVQEQHVSKTAEQTLEQFAVDPKNEFFNDVRDMMADLIEAGRASSLDEAYSACIWANPDTRKILLQREAEQRAVTKGKRAVIARQASAAVHGTPRAAGGVSGNPNMSLRDTIAAAFDAQESA